MKNLEDYIVSQVEDSIRKIEKVGLEQQEIMFYMEELENENLYTIIITYKGKTYCVIKLGIGLLHSKIELKEILCFFMNVKELYDCVKEGPGSYYILKDYNLNGFIKIEKIDKWIENVKEHISKAIGTSQISFNGC